jgi:hypothetical protein
MKSPDNDTVVDWHIALVDFVRATENPDTLGLFDQEDLGAVGWLGVLTSDKDEIERMVRQCLNEVGLHVLSVEDARRIYDLKELIELDEILLENIQERPVDDPLVVWGKLHIYIAEGEA